MLYWIVFIRKVVSWCVEISEPFLCSVLLVSIFQNFTAKGRLKTMTLSIFPKLQLCCNSTNIIFNVKQLQEEYRWQNLSLYQSFLNLYKAYDIVNRSFFSKVLSKIGRGVPEKFVNLVYSEDDEMKVEINFSRNLSEPIPVENYFKQGDVPVPFTNYFTFVFIIDFKNNPNGIYMKYWTSTSF